MLFDGVCNFCDGSVRFLIPRDPAGHLAFAPLQSQAGQRLLAEHGMQGAETRLDTMVLIEAGQVYERSTAALRTLRHLSGAWPLLSWLTWVPRPIRDWCYDQFARRRYRWFGRLDECLVPDRGVRARFLDGATTPADPDVDGDQLRAVVSK